jgi:hypothetical protein
LQRTQWLGACPRVDEESGVRHRDSPGLASTNLPG